MKCIEKFVFGTQYYRAPTPTPGEWEDDIERIAGTGLHLIQVRPQWRWHERIRGQFEWADIDAIFELCDRYSVKIMFKFMLENAPQWLYDMYGCERVGRNGQKLLPGAHAAFYVGGWLPCFDDPHVRTEADRFIAEAVNRYKDSECLLLWNAWNEPRSRPEHECCCEYSKESYREWLRKRFKSIETFNAFLGKAWGSWEEVMPPSMDEDYAELYMWRQWAMHSVMDRVDWVYKAIREVDSKHPIMTHVGMCSLIQDPICDSSDDWLNASKVDFYGTSYPVFNFVTHAIDYSAARLKAAMICDWIRNISSYYWINEMYPNGGDFCPDVDSQELGIWIWIAIAHGAKGIVFWQYKAERLGLEANLAGLVNLDGTETDRSAEVAKIAYVVEKHEDIFLNMEVPKPDVAIVYDHRSDILSRIRERMLDLPISSKDCLLGAYSLFWTRDVPVDWISSHQLERIYDYKLVYIPDLEVMNQSNAEILVEYVAEGGCLVAEMLLGLHSDNTWRNAKVPGFGLDTVFGSIQDKPLLTKKGDTYSCYGVEGLQAYGARVCLQCSTADCVGKWKGGGISTTQNAYGKGKAIAIGSNLGRDFLKYGGKKTREIVDTLIEQAGINNKLEVIGAEGSVKVRLLLYRTIPVVFVFNFGENTQVIRVKSPSFNVPYDLIGETRLTHNDEKELVLEITPRQVVCIVEAQIITDQRQCL